MSKKGMEDVTINRQSKVRLTCEISSSQSDLCPHGTSWKGLETTTCHGCNTKSTQYSCYSGNVPGLYILLRVELLTPFTSGLPFLLCSSFVLTLLIRKQRLVVLLFRSIVLRSQTYLQSVTLNSLLCSISGYSACCAP